MTTERMTEGAATGTAEAAGPADAAATGDRSDPPRAATCPNAGTAAAAEIERARSAMLSRRQAAEPHRIGADALCEALIRQGVDVIFGYPGGVILPLYDVWDDYPSSATSSSATSRAPPTRPTATPAPAARSASASGTSRPRRHQPGHRHRHRAARLRSPWSPSPATCPARSSARTRSRRSTSRGITLPMTKHNYLVRNADDIPRVIAEAFHIARTGRPGPVHVDITKDALTSETRAQHPDTIDLPGFKPTLRGPSHARSASRAEAIEQAQRPVILAGHGILLVGRDGRAQGVRREDPDPGRPHAAGRRRHRRAPPAVATASWACTAGSTSTGPSSRPTCSSRWACASTTG